MSAFLYTLAGAVVGGLISLAVSYYFAQQGSQELRNEAEDVKHYVDALISYLEAAGMIRVVRDDDGRPIETHIIRLSGVIEGKSDAVGTLTVTQDDPLANQDEETPQQ